ncbi:MAG: Rieske 2Fe-2S domain-containing protein [Mycolicibacterium sp.]|nr:Rieske 2Fe-2S domain-containing protein [Mycolicibacterium sp.]
MADRKRRRISALNRRRAEVIEALGRQEWLDRPSYRFENVLSFAFNSFGSARNRVTNFLNGVWLGHPVHPPLASLASGVLGATLVLDGIQVALGERPEAHHAGRLAGHTLGVGILANLGSAATGVTDWQHTHEQDRRIGLIHGLLNLGATGLYSWSWVQRRRHRHGRAQLATFVGYGISMFSGYLGGHLVFASGIGTDQSGRRLDTREWTPVIEDAALADGKLHRVVVDGVGVVLARADRNVAAVGEFCPHLAAPMVDGWVDRGNIVCPWHGSQFDACTGEVVRGPASAPLPCYQARTRNGMVEVRGAGQPAIAGDISPVEIVEVAG